MPFHSINYSTLQILFSAFCMFPFSFNFLFQIYATGLQTKPVLVSFWSHCFKDQTVLSIHKQEHAILVSWKQQVQQVRDHLAPVWDMLLVREAKQWQKEYQNNQGLSMHCFKCASQPELNRLERVGYYFVWRVYYRLPPNLVVQYWRLPLHYRIWASAAPAEKLVFDLSWHWKQAFVFWTHDYTNRKLVQKQTMNIVFSQK